MFWVIAIVAIGVGAFWVKTRRQRKAKATTYVPQ
jgi:hypothetical protein